MNILMMTNTFSPIVGGLERSVADFSKEYRKRGHRTVIVAPEFRDAPMDEEDVIRVPAIQHFNGSDFSLQLPIPGALKAALGNFKPDIVHSHHPFLIGDTALRIAHTRQVPLIFTHHTLYEQNTHYVPGDSQALKRFVIKLSSGYANLSDHVFAPSVSVRRLLRQRGVETPIDVVPTGIYVEKLAAGDGRRFRDRWRISKEIFIVGYVGRLAPEKNLDFLSQAVAGFLQREPFARFLVVGEGPSQKKMADYFQSLGLKNRLILSGKLQGSDLTDAYRAMDVFAFASQSETQGVVLTEAMAASVPVVAVDACGVRDIVKDRVNGRLVSSENKETFISALRWFLRLEPRRRRLLNISARETAMDFSMDKCAERALALYAIVTRRKRTPRPVSNSLWAKTRAMIQAEWKIFKNLTKATGAAIEKAVY